MIAPERIRLQTPYPHRPEFGPGWTDLWFRPGTDDEDVIREVWVEDVYRIRGVDLTAKQDRSKGWITNALGTRTAAPDIPTTVIDLGANIGTFSALCLALGASQVIAVEPHPDNLALLRRNLDEHDKRVRIIPAAVGAEHATLAMVGDTGTAHTSRDGEGTVVQVTLADILDQINGRVALLKCDIEGGEYDVFTHPIEHLARVDRIHMEWHGPAMTPWRGEPADGWPIGEIVEELLSTHAVQVFGDPLQGGMLFATRYNL